MAIQRTESETIRAFYHTLNNRINALALGIGILQQHDEAQVREIAITMEMELDALHELLENRRCDTVR